MVFELLRNIIATNNDRYNQLRIMGGINPKVHKEQEHHARGMKLPISSIKVSYIIVL